MWPKSVVFQTPPLLTPIRNSFGLPGMPVAPTVRPPRNGPMHRHFSAAYAPESNGGAAVADDTSDASNPAAKMRRRRDTVDPPGRNRTADPNVTSPPGGGKHMTSAESVTAQVSTCHQAQRTWAARPLRDRLRPVRALRHLLVEAA